MINVITIILILILCYFVLFNNISENFQTKGFFKKEPNPDYVSLESEKERLVQALQELTTKED